MEVVSGYIQRAGFFAATIVVIVVIFQLVKKLVTSGELPGILILVAMVLHLLLVVITVVLDIVYDIEDDLGLLLPELLTFVILLRLSVLRLTGLTLLFDIFLGLSVCLFERVFLQGQTFLGPLGNNHTSLLLACCKKLLSFVFDTLLMSFAPLSFDFCI